MKVLKVAGTSLFDLPVMTEIGKPEKLKDGKARVKGLFSKFSISLPAGKTEHNYLFKVLVTGKAMENIQNTFGGLLVNPEQNSLLDYGGGSGWTVTRKNAYLRIADQTGSSVWAGLVNNEGTEVKFSLPIEKPVKLNATLWPHSDMEIIFTSPGVIIAK